MDLSMPLARAITSSERRLPQSYHGDEVSKSLEPVVWLDLLPIDTSARIAALLRPWRFNCDPLDRSMGYLIEWFPDPFHLANVSGTQRRATALAQNHTIRLERLNDCAHAVTQVAFWGAVLGDQLREVRLPSNFYYQFNDGMHDILSRPSIRKATIPNSQALMRAFVAGGSLRHLNIEMMRIADVHIIERVTVSDILKSCPIEHLSISCNSCVYYSRIPCLTMKALKAMNREPKCTTITSLKLTSPAERIHDIANTLPTLPNLENLCLQHWFPKSSLYTSRIQRIFDLSMSSACEEQLCSIKSVSMFNCGAVDLFAPLLGKRLTKLASKSTVSCEDMRMLENCPNLEHLELVLDCRAEVFFPTNLRSLKSVTLSWSSLERKTLKSKKHAPKPEFFVGLVRRNEHLRKLHLKGVIVPPSVQEEIIVCIGDRLESLQLPLLNKTNYDMDMMKELLKLIMRYNPNISNLVFEDWLFSEVRDTVRGCKTHRYEKCLTPDIRAACRDCKRWEPVDVVWNVLKRRLPKLNYSSIEQLRWFFYKCQKRVMETSTTHNMLYEA